jgi:hypothetical protein
MVLLTSMVFGAPEPVTTGTRLIEDLQSNNQEAENERLNQYDSDGHKEIARQSSLHWMLDVGIMATKVHPVGDRAQWFSTYLASLATRPESARSEDLDSIRKRYMYSKVLEDEIQLGRPFRKFDVLTGLHESCGMSWREPYSEVVLEDP